MRMLRHLEETAQVIVDTADCAIGIDAANLILTSVRGAGFAEIKRQAGYDSSPPSLLEPSQNDVTL